MKNYREGIHEFIVSRTEEGLFNVKAVSFSDHDYSAFGISESQLYGKMKEITQDIDDRWSDEGDTYIFKAKCRFSVI